MNARFRLKDGWELHARTAPDAMGLYGPALREIVLWGPEPNAADDPPGVTRLRNGMSYWGDSWKECFRRLREDQVRNGWMTVELVSPGGHEGSVLAVEVVDLSAAQEPFTANFIGSSVAGSPESGER